MAADARGRAGTRGGGPLALLLRLGLWAVLLLFTAWYLLPLLVMVSTSLKDMDEIRAGSLISPPASLNTDAWVAAWTQACVGETCAGLAPFFVNSLTIAVPAVLIATVLGALNGYALTKWRFRGSDVIFAVMLFGCFIPFQVVLVPMAGILEMVGLAGTIPGLVLVHVVFGLSFTTLFFRTFYVSVPQALINAATIEGAGFFRIFFRIMLPLSWPIVLVTIIWQFTMVWNDFLFGVTFAGADTQPVTVALNTLVRTSAGLGADNVDMAATLITALPTVIVFLLAGKYFVRGLATAAVRG